MVVSILECFFRSTRARSQILDEEAQELAGNVVVNFASIFVCI